MIARTRPHRQQGELPGPLHQQEEGGGGEGQAAELGGGAAGGRVVGGRVGGPAAPPRDGQDGGHQEGAQPQTDERIDQVKQTDGKIVSVKDI